MCETQEQYELAKESYEKLLNEDQKLEQTQNQLTLEQTQQERLSNTVKSEIYKQLGWMHHVLDKLPTTNSTSIQNSQQIAIQCLHKSFQLYPSSGQSLYLLGRCLAGVGNSYEAFQAYRQSVDIAEANADTWCSIG